jgi:hypothetical protein
LFRANSAQAEQNLVEEASFTHSQLLAGYSVFLHHAVLILTQTEPTPDEKLAIPADHLGKTSTRSTGLLLQVSGAAKSLF